MSSKQEAVAQKIFLGGHVRLHGGVDLNGQWMGKDIRGVNPNMASLLSLALLTFFWPSSNARTEEFLRTINPLVST